MEINWSEVIDFCASQHIVLKAFLNGSVIDVKGNELNVYLKSKSRFMLEQKKADTIIEDYLKNKYNFSVKVKFVEDDVCVQDSLAREREIVKNLMESRPEISAVKEEKPKPKENTQYPKASQSERNTG